SLSVRRSGCPVGSHAWMLIAMFQLAMDLTACESAAGGQGLRLAQRPSPRHRLPRGPWWSPKSGQELRMPGPAWTPVSAHPDRPHGLLTHAVSVCASARSAACASRLRIRCGRASDAAGGPSSGPQARTREAREVTLPPVATALQLRKTNPTLAALTGSAVPAAGEPPAPPLLSPRRTGCVCRLGFARCYPGCPLFPIPTLSLVFFFAGLAVHQIITITVSLIMVIAALITTLVLKNCCVQSGNTRRNSHQRKINQQEESCQNLTDFTPARVPSSLDIFTAYNETLQCSHECVRTPVPVYTEEALHSPGDYKTTFNGNRPSSSDRHLIPVAFVSEKWFEISC
ncbi:AJAP1 protein, partial [Dromaius novaehollandiae]|nr:AJAP1 protein [Dromaius novaehollandiae]